MTSSWLLCWLVRRVGVVEIATTKYSPRGSLCVTKLMSASKTSDSFGLVLLEDSDISMITATQTGSLGRLALPFVVAPNCPRLAQGRSDKVRAKRTRSFLYFMGRLLSEKK